MSAHRHLIWFMALGLFWGLSPSIYKHLAEIAMPVSHTVFWTGIGVGVAMFVIGLMRGGGSWRYPARIMVYGAACAFLMNIPFGINLYLAQFVPPTELAIVITTSPFFAYLAALLTGWEQATSRRLWAIAAGFASTVVLIVTREASPSGDINWWLVAAFAIPLLYAIYNMYAARAWPEGANTIEVGAAESLFSGLLILPVLLWFAPFGAAGQPELWQYWILGATCLMWIVERIAYFTLINEKGAVYTVQATYVSTPAAVLIAALFFGGATDIWLWLSLALLMVALYLNNSGRHVSPAEDRTLHQNHTQPVAAVNQGQ